jgi:NhaA family Na+:H+ antiporter
VTRAARRPEVVAGLALLGATVVALVLANSPWRAGYEDAWRAHVAGLDLHEWVDDALMAVFFLAVGLEVHHELVDGDLRDRRHAALPVMAAAGGMVVPALLYAAANVGGAGARGWGIPMATDVAFALGVLALVAPNVPQQVRVFLLTLAVVDDIGAVAVIAVFYSGAVDARWLAAAALAVAVAFAMRNASPTTTTTTYRAPAFVALGVAAWLALRAAGVHPTLAGVAMGLVAPRAWLAGLRRCVEPLSSFVVVPLFALANAGVHLSGGALGDAARSPVTLGVVAGLVVGKTVGITGATLVGHRWSPAELWPGIRRRDVMGLAALGGIGFTVSLFVTGLAFEPHARLVADAKIGILAASLLAGVLGTVLLRRSGA